MTTDTKEQVEADMFFTDQLGGDYIGNIIKSGNIIFLLDSQPLDINEIKLTISRGHNENFESIGSDFVFEIPF